MIPFNNSYVHLPAQMFTRQTAKPVPDPTLIIANARLATTLGIDPDWLNTPAARDIFAGNAVADGSEPLASAYAGHQFGNWNPGLGDGRALLLGEVLGTDGVRRDIQLKGSGPTPYSRSGDGRAWLGPVLREYLVSEAMHAMGVPTTRALAAVTTGETVVREEPLPGAIITRVAQSHIRVGTFQLMAARGDIDALSALFDHVVDRHFPEVDSPAALLTAVTKAQAKLIAKWMSVGFVHGVMNTDNVSIAGETIDYGPCAFMDVYDAASVFSAIDRQGRYAYQNQPRIAVWNLAQFATSLIPLMPDQDAAIEEFTAIINAFPTHYEAQWITAFGAKLGLDAPSEDDRALISDLLGLMQQDRADFTNTFANLAGPDAHDQFVDRAAFQAWSARWQARGYDADIMATANPVIIPRNHQVEAVIAAGRDADFSPCHALLAAVTQPYAPATDATAAFARAPAMDERVTQTFCGT
ncbi:MAG: YdiU family protein [Yoonia sp.]|nr:YdiU family protein [Yoonia sp.]